MTPDSAARFQQVYGEWHRPLLQALIGDEMDLHYDLYELTHSHRFEHNGGDDEGSCIAFPSPPYRALIWRIIAAETGATRFLEVGTAVGYTPALMAEAGGSGCRVDTLENDEAHADIAEEELAKRGLADRVRIHRGDAGETVSALTGAYDVVFLDSGGADISAHFERLLRPGGVRPEIKGRLAEPLLGFLEALRDSLEAQGSLDAAALERARKSYREAVVTALHNRGD